MTISIALLLAIASPLDAQIIQRPERPIRGVFGGGPPPDPARTRQELTLTLTSLGGYDDNPAPVESSGIDALTLREPGYTGFADGALRYWRGRQSRSLELRGRGYLNTFRNLGLTPSYGGDVAARASTSLGRRHQMDLSASSRSDPFYSLGAFGPLRGSVDTSVLPDANSANGFFPRRSWTHASSSSLVSRWSARNTLTSAYGYEMRDFVDNVGDSHSHRASLDYLRALGRRSSIRATYRHSDSEFLEFVETVEMIRPLTEQAAELGYQHDRRYTRTNRFFVSFGAGATHVTTISGLSRVPLIYTIPSGYGSTRLDVSRTWSIWADYRRGVSVLEGLTTETFTTDTALVRIGGFAGSRSEIVFSTAFSNGAAPTPESIGRFDSYTATAQLRVMLTRSWSVVASHSFYAYRLYHVANLPIGVPNRLDRNAVRVGMTLDLPLYGSTLRPAGGR